jgi:glycosyltransferase involved in cell wall biosynthesis
VGKMKILMLLSKEFKNDYRAYREAKVLAEEDNEVTIIMWDRLGEGPSEEKVDKILVIRVCNDYLMRKLPHDLFRNPLWWREAYKRAIELCRDEKFDVIHCHDLDTLPIGVRLKKARGVKLVYDVHEVFGYMIMRNMPKLISKISFYMEKKLIKSVDHVITVSKPVKRYLEGITNKPVTIVRNCKDLIIKEYTPPKNELFTISYIGILHKNRMFPELVDIVGKIDGIRFLIAGKKENLYKEVEKRCEKYENVEFLGTIPIEEVIPKTLESNVVISILDPNDPNCRIALLNKQFEAMVCGRPIIVTRGTYAGKMTEELKCGLTVDYTKESVRDAIVTLRDNPDLCRELGMNAFMAAKERYNWENEKNKLLEVYRRM